MPSTVSQGIDQPPAMRSASTGFAIWRATGVEYEYWLRWSTKTAGTCHTPARPSASCVSPTENAPSPRNVSATRGSPRRANASAAPTVTDARSPSIETSGKTPRAGTPKCMFPSRPRVGESARPRKFRNASAGVTPRAKWAASSRLSGATTSLRPEREPGRRGDCLLASSVVERARDPALPVQRQGTLLEEPLEQHEPEEREARRAVDARRGRRTGQ